MYAGWLAMGGVEIVNSTRAAAYASIMGITTVQCDTCPTLPRALNELPYTSPDADCAPWFDTAEPDSKDFAGLLGLEVTGLAKSVARREVVSLVTDGAALHPLRRTHREIQVRALMLAKTECAMSYGYSWLASALRGDQCVPGCAGDALCFFTCCPAGCNALLPADSPDQPPCCGDPPEDGLDTCGNREFRQMLNTGLLAMDDPDTVRKISGGWLAEVTFTLAAGDPFIYREPLLMATGPQPSQQLPDYEDPGVPPSCTEPADCLSDPSCPPPPAPVLPPPAVDACFPTGPFTAARYVINIDPDSVPTFASKVPLIFVRAGAKKLERLTIRWYSNPSGVECTDVLDPCLACNEVNVSFVPAGATLTIDGRTETAYVDCPGGPGLTTAEPQLYGRGGSPFVWPSFDCGEALCVEVISKADSLATDALIELYAVIREDAV